MAAKISRSRIQSITLQFHGRDGREADVRLDPRKKYDALFLNLAGLDRFAVPYYAARDGIGAALKLRKRVERVLRQARGAAVALHQGMCTMEVRALAWRRRSARL